MDLHPTTSADEVPPLALLAGGLATRLRPITETIPKSLVEVAGRPFVFHQLELLRDSGIERVVLCVGHLGEMVRETVGDGSRFGVRVDYVFDGPVPLGTGGALRQARMALGPEFFVLYGDSYLEMDYRDAWRAFRKSGKLGLMTVYRNEGKFDVSNVIFREGVIVDYDKTRRDPAMEHIDYGLGLLQAHAFDLVPEGRPFDLADVYRDLVKRGELAGYEVDRRFYEIGSPSGLQETHDYLTARAESKP